MSLSIILLAVVVAIGAGAWLMFGSRDEEPEATADEAPPQPSSFRCNVCGKVSATFLAAHEHASAEHELAGHKIDESITAS
jgi:hypothetical protein